MRTPGGAAVGHVTDVVVQWPGDPYPPVSGLTVRARRRQVFVAVAGIFDLGIADGSVVVDEVDPSAFQRRERGRRLVAEVIKHEMVDLDGVRVIRPADLYLARVTGEYSIVGADGGAPRRVRWRGRTGGHGRSHTPARLSIGRRYTLS